MGYYVPNGQPLEDYETAQLLNEAPANFNDVPNDKAIICEVDNGMFKAYGYAYSPQELEVFKSPDGRSKRWFTMDKDLTNTITNYK